MTPGTKLTHQIMLALSEQGCAVWKNPTGTGYQGQIVHKDSSTITLANYRTVTFGLAVGSSDLICISPSGQFMAVEVKAGKDRPTADQRLFIEAINRRHGSAGFARSVQDALDLIKK